MTPSTPHSTRSEEEEEESLVAILVDLEAEDQEAQEAQEDQEVQVNLSNPLLKSPYNQQETSEPWVLRPELLREIEQNRRIGSRNLEATTELTLESQGLSHQYAKWPSRSPSSMDPK
jgi:hypothetical protein